MTASMDEAAIRAALREELERIYPAQKNGRTNLTPPSLLQDVARHGPWKNEEVWRVIQEAIVEGVLLPGSPNAIDHPHLGQPESFVYWLTISEYGWSYVQSAKSQPDPHDAESILQPLRARGIANDTVESYVPEAVRCFKARAFKGTSVLLGVAAESVTEDVYDAFLSHLPAIRSASFQKALTVNRLSAEGRWDAFTARFPTGHEACLGDELKRRFLNVFEPQLKLFKQNRDDAAHRRATLISQDGALASLFSFVPFGVTAADILAALKAPCVGPV
jgi:hypothetical protein